MSNDFPQVMSTKKLKDLLELIPEIGVPSQVDKKFLQENGYTSSHDQKLIQPLKFIGLVENKSRGGAPTQNWQQARGELQEVVGRGIREGYSELFSKFPNAHQRDAESLINFFKANTSQSADAAKRMADTFLALCEIGDLDVDERSEAENVVADTPAADIPQPATVAPNNSPHSNGSIVTVATPGNPSVTINIELHVPPDASGEVYEKFFKAMKDHLITQLQS